jgi:hypothetical protein
MKKLIQNLEPRIMKSSLAIKSIAAYALFTWAGGAFAHEGHGLAGTHWHATDTLGLIAVAALAAAVIFGTRGK